MTTGLEFDNLGYASDYPEFFVSDIVLGILMEFYFPGSLPDAALNSLFFLVNNRTSGEYGWDPASIGTALLENKPFGAYEAFIRDLSKAVPINESGELTRAEQIYQFCSLVVVDTFTYLYLENATKKQ